MAFKDYYEILQVSPKAHAEVIKSAYRTMMNKMNIHPDKGGDTERAKLINEAYAILTDSSRREAYDKEYREYFSKGNLKAKNENISKGGGELANTSWSRDPMTDQETYDIANAKIRKLVDFEEFKDLLKEHFRNKRGY